MKLELRHLAPYLPYGLKIRYIERNETHILNNYNLDAVCSEQNHLRPILRPLSDLTKEIEVNGEKFVPSDRLGLTDENILEFNISFCPYWIVKILLEWHFDVFGLIEKGLAIDINTL